MSRIGVPSSMSTPRTRRASAFAGDQLDHGESDRIRPERRTCREDAVRTVIAGRRSRETDSFGAVEDPDHIQVREAFDVQKARLEFRQNFERSFGLVLRAESSRNVLSTLVRASYISDGLHGEHKGLVRLSASSSR